MPDIPESVAEALTQPTIDDYDIYSIPVSCVSLLFPFWLRAETHHLQGREAQYELVMKISTYLTNWRNHFQQKLTTMPPPDITSVFISPKDTGHLYLECRSPKDCARLLEIFHYSARPSLVELENRKSLLLSSAPYSQFLATNIRDLDLAPHVWIRTRDGDLAYVLESTPESYVALRVPSLPTTGRSSSRRLLSFSDVQRLLDPTRQGTNFKPSDLDPKLFALINKASGKRRVFLGGLERIDLPRFRATVVHNPNPQELLVFVEAQENSARVYKWVQETKSGLDDEAQSTFNALKGTFFQSEEFDWLTAEVLLQYADGYYASSLEEGDRVVVKVSAPSELRGQSGSIVETTTNDAQIETRDGLRFRANRLHLRKLFYTGDSVKAISGPHEGITGIVVVVNETIAHIISGTMAALMSNEGDPKGSSMV